ncbi:MULTISPECIES: hemerythrin domain-containing protein [Hydrocarboniphaga]|jgi:hypothetical protein|uniref:Hemerythrin-like domain-containing protein n=2 Tax=Hydrocarboniphaga effusa TaxID=243629 RepID=I8T5D7_9GAMM|nr:MULTISPECIES: hemerythrin domain-containing protein [Hydrocarboniphaga]EIT68943.1 hypothetical protein WQQ_25250 [Hydrocarboniphaga effusa AP103]MDZ4081174.1 hemerythrin domain-containing protein [Hydrocarboniphaga sp.]
MTFPTAPRYDLYAGIHKALRAFMADTLVAIGRMDEGDAADTGPALAQLRALLGCMRAHLGHENEFIHPLLESVAVGAAARISIEHVEHQREIATLEAQVDAFEAADASARPALALKLYRELALFVGENFSHMQYEEVVHGAQLWAHCSDAQLLDLEHRIVASQTPDEAMLVLRWMLPYMTHAERCALLFGMRAMVPAPVFAAVLELARAHLREGDWIKLDAALSAPSLRAA